MNRVVLSSSIVPDLKALKMALKENCKSRNIQATSYLRRKIFLEINISEMKTVK